MSNALHTRATSWVAATIAGLVTATGALAYTAGEDTKASSATLRDIEGKWITINDDGKSTFRLTVASDQKGHLTCVVQASEHGVYEPCTIQRRENSYAITAAAPVDPASETPPLRHVILGHKDAGTISGAVFPDKQRIVLYLQGSADERTRRQSVSALLDARREEDRQDILKAANGSWKFADSENYYYAGASRTDVYSWYTGQILVDIPGLSGSYALRRHQCEPACNDSYFNGTFEMLRKDDQVWFNDLGGSGGSIHCSIDALGLARRGHLSANCKHYLEQAQIPTVLSPK